MARRNPAVVLLAADLEPVSALRAERIRTHERSSRGLGNGLNGTGLRRRLAAHGNRIRRVGSRRATTVFPSGSAANKREAENENGEPAHGVPPRPWDFDAHIIARSATTRLQASWRPGTTQAVRRGRRTTLGEFPRSLSGPRQILRQDPS